ncbi:hypothetical protein QA649_08860 [Bradyrhizobium sp. CB1717]|uniref:hypothetical protein n=1 Tax=Bradyrhizobium sp. CB1717 TaxID=3039154 RepID=UPI0024B155F6|nr:hypothetical protein [Bradyrhizobium sp. CB1717]WFU26300.1 hypothetical protein QA649_08860 [Bradyrhizobium sp. CB1717]
MMYRLATILGFLFALSCHSEAWAGCPDGTVEMSPGQCVPTAIGELGGDDDEPTPPAAVGSACDTKELLENFKWFHGDAPKNSHTAEVRGILMRIANYDTATAIKSMRAAYKEGQHHKATVAALVDYCDDESVRRTAYNFVEAGRLQKCGDPAPALSATCMDIRENIRWALDDAETCFIYAHWYMKLALAEITMPLRERGQLIREGFKIAQGHKQEVFDSIDYIGDALLVEMVRNYDKKSHLLEGHDYRKYNGAEAACPGIKKRFRHWTYGSPP